MGGARIPCPGQGLGAQLSIFMASSITANLAHASHATLTDVVRRPDDLSQVLGVLDDPRHLQVAQLDLAVGKLAHQHDVLGLRRQLLINQISI